MKKMISLILSVLMIFSLAACGAESTATPEAPEAANLKFGTAVYVDAPKASDASADANGAGEVDVTVAAVTVDAEGKIVACKIDTMQSKLQYNAEGKAVGNPEAKTKREQGMDYGMVAYGGATKEWFEQADALEQIVAGKTLDQVKALVVDGYKGNDEVINAGCTIGIASYIAAIEKAYNAAAESNVTADATLKVTAYTVQDIKDATADAAGENKASVYTYAAAVDAAGKVIAGNSDCVEVAFTFDTAGKSTFDTTKAILSKKEQGANYGMVAYGGAAKEWFEQAAAFDAQCIGKTGEEIKGLMSNDGKGNADVVNAGCTIYVNGFVAAASKI